ncbi:hypothetical protein Vadar_004775 [Vaccinium darrowii]|uniref:Uncharacterized protein n=1 Tax=Vaccinium darrowii TaxID=229202 RepID=A0ACB7Z9N4_9ERIC|nr:hypothetical protein Vadar_004775 [Vaccinium darrowii]
MELLASMKEFFQLRWLRLEALSILVLDSKVPNPMDEFLESAFLLLCQGRVASRAAQQAVAFIFLAKEKPNGSTVLQPENGESFVLEGHYRDGMLLLKNWQMRRFMLRFLSPMNFVRGVIALFSISTGSRSVCCLPSMLAAATVLHVIKEVEPCHALDYENELMDVLNLNLSRDKVDGLSKLIQELYGNNGDVTHKRKYEPLSTSPNGVIDAHFSSDCSNESWAVTSSVSSSPKPLFKKRRNHDQKMRLDP